MTHLTCSSVGGFCDEALKGDSADEMIDNTVSHMEEAHSEDYSRMTSIDHDRMAEMIRAAFPGSTADEEGVEEIA